MKNQTTHISSIQEKYILQALVNVQKVIKYKLGVLYEDSIDDLSQRVFYKFWVWKSRRNEDLKFEECQKIINVTVNTEIAQFFSERHHQEIPISQFNEYAQECILSTNSLNYRIEGNSEAEMDSILLIIWRELKVLTLRQRYALILYDADLLIEFIRGKCCSTVELADYFEMTVGEISQIMEEIPISDKKIGMMLETKINQKVSPNQLWEARSKAKAKLRKQIAYLLSQ